ncbi:hypothetical protein [Streptomyces sp. NPDC086010]|uniref:hypothetical protein n=1 Tax=Streptomyces sp. NPDC086010 TaxID=3365745 RepID=UPI0037D22D92
METVTAAGHEMVRVQLGAVQRVPGMAELTGLLDGAPVAVDVSVAPTVDAAEYLLFHQSLTINLLAAELAAGVGHDTKWKENSSESISG